MISYSRMSLKRWICLLFVACIPLSWASFVFGSVYRSLTLVLFLIFLLNMGKWYSIPQQNKRLFVAWSLFVGYTVLTLFWCRNFGSSFYNSVGMGLIFVIAFIFANTDWTENSAQRMDAVWIMVGLICSLLFLFGGRTQISKYSGRETLVILGTETDANEFAGALIVPFSLTIHKLLQERRLVKKLLYAALAMLELYVILLSGSRGALYGTVVATIVAIFMQPKKSVGLVLSSGILMLVLLGSLTNFILPIIPNDVLDRLTIDSVLDSGGSGRATLWRNAFRVLRDSSIIRLLFGYGQDGLIIRGVIGRTGTMHNQLLQMIVNGGFVGLVLYCGLIWESFKALLKRNRRYIGGYIGMMVLNLTLSLPPSYKPLWILLMMAFVTEASYVLRQTK